MGIRNRFLALAGLLALAACTDEPTRPGPELAPGPRHGSNASPAATVSYQAHVQDWGWMGWVSEGQVAGTLGQDRRLEALQVSLSGSTSPSAEVCYQGHVENYGWMGEVCGNGQTIGTTGQALRLEAVRIRLRNAPDLSICYKAYVQGTGWQNEVCDGEVAGTTGLALRMEAITIRLRKPFYAWTDSRTGTPNGVLLQGTAGVGQHESYARQFVWAGNCEKYFQVDNAFVDRNKGKHLIYIIGDEPDHDGATCLYTPEEYARVFRDAVAHIRSIDPTARFSNGGFTQPNATPAGYPHFTDYADRFIAAYRGLTGQDPPVAEWRFHGLAVDAATFAAWMNQAAAWAAARGQKIFVGSFNGPDMAAMVDHVKNDSRIVGAAWWSYDAVNRWDGSPWPYALTNPDGTLNARGQQYVQVTK